MTANVHPTSSELLTALHEPDRAASTLEHIEECLACRVRLSRIRHTSGPAPASAHSLQRIVEASTPLPNVLADMVSGDQDRAPQPNEIWRVGQREALLVWIRQVFEDGVADVIPLVLDTELADQESVVIGADATPLATEIAAMVSLRTHVHLGAFLNRVGALDIRKDVTEVMTAVREGRRPSGVHVGPPIDDDDDQRLEYRQALRDLLVELSPSAWQENQDDPELVAAQRTSEPAANHPPGDVDVIKTQLGERLLGVSCRDIDQRTLMVDGATRAASVMKVVYLDTAVLVTTLHGESLTDFPEVGAVVAACQKMADTERDADAVAIAIPRDDWPTMLFTTAHMRSAFELPGGALTGPTATLEGYGLVDTLCKHLEGAVTAWEVTEPASNRIGPNDLHTIVVRHASESIERITNAGKRALQPAKRAAWQNLPEKLGEQVARFVVAVINEETIADALRDLPLETRND